MNTCTTCKHYQKSATDSPAYDLCLNPALKLNQRTVEQYRLIRGVDPPEPPTATCAVARTWSDECGRDGLLWEPKEAA